MLDQPEYLEKVSMLKILILWQRVANEPLHARASRVQEQWQEVCRAATGGREAYHCGHRRRSDAMICTDHRRRPSNGHKPHCARSAFLASLSLRQCAFFSCMCADLSLSRFPRQSFLCVGGKRLLKSYPSLRVPLGWMLTRD